MCQKCTTKLALFGSVQYKPAIHKYDILHKEGIEKLTWHVVRKKGINGANRLCISHFEGEQAVVCVCHSQGNRVHSIGLHTSIEMLLGCEKKLDYVAYDRCFVTQFGPLKENTPSCGCVHKGTVCIQSDCTPLPSCGLILKD